MSWLQLVQALSTDVVARLSTAGLPPLVDGQIFVGPEHEEEHRTAPAIVMVPLGSDFIARRDAPRGGVNNPQAPGAAILYVALTASGINYTTATVTISAPDLSTGVRATATAVVVAGGIQTILLTNVGSGYLKQPTVTITGDGTGATAAAAVGPSAEAQQEIRQRALWSEGKKFRVSVWGVTYTNGQPTPNPDSDWDFCELMYQVFIQSCQGLMAGCYKLSKGLWVSSLPGSTKLNIYGRLYTFELEIGTPVPDTALLFVPVGTKATSTVIYKNPDGTSQAA
jgi:hypothetical protein